MRSDRPTEQLHKVTLNLYVSDVVAFRQRYGFGWSEQIRNVVHLNVKDWERQRQVMDLIEDDEHYRYDGDK